MTARAMLDAKGDQKLIPIIVHKKWEDPDLKDVPLTRDYIKSKAGQDGVALYNAWVNQYEFQRPWGLRLDVPKIAWKRFAKLLRKPSSTRNLSRRPRRQS